MGFTPVVIPEMTFGYSAGLYRNIMSCRTMLTMSLVCMTLATASIVEIFFYRWQTLVHINSKWKFKKSTYCVIWGSAVMLLFLAIFKIHNILETDQVYWRYKMNEILSCTEFLFQQPAAYKCESQKYLSVVIYGIVTCLIAFFVTFACIFHSLKNISEMRSNRSTHARNVQRRLILLLCAQLFFPLSAYAIGGTIIVVSMSFQLSWMQTAFNIAVLMFSNYGFAASISLLFCNEPYRRQTRQYLYCVKCDNKTVMKTVKYIQTRPRQMMAL